jgi:hypothetical protein
MFRIVRPELSIKGHRTRVFALSAATGLALAMALIAANTPSGLRTEPGKPNLENAASPLNPLSSLPTIPWEGGSGYWANFSRANAAGWSDPKFFPISVFMGKPDHAAALKSIGINTYMGAEHDGSAISKITSQGMFVVPQDEWTPAEVGNEPNAIGWFISDECDIGLGCSGLTAADNLVDQTNKVNRVHALGDGRFTMANYSNGVLDTYWAQGSMAGLMNVVDVASVDKYAYTSPFVDGQMTHSPHWPIGGNPVSAGSYGWLADRMRTYQNPMGGHPNWVFLEAAMPLLTDAGSLTIATEQIEGAAWSAIIHEARGLAYFQHNNGQTCGFYALVDCDQARLDRIKAINAGIQSLAPVINTQSYVFSFNTTTDTMLKAYGGSAYIFAGIGLRQSPGLKTFVTPPEINGTTVEVVGENRTLPVSNHTFSDTFENEYSHHTYRVSL